MAVFVAKEERHAVVLLRVTRRHLDSRTLGGGHELERFRFEQLTLLNGAPDAEEIGDGAAEPEIVADGTAVFGSCLVMVADALVAVREPVNDRGVVARRRRSGAGGSEEVLLHVFGVGLARDAFENFREELKVGDRPVPLCPRFVDPLAIGEECDDFIHGFGLAVAGFQWVAAVVVVDDAGGVADEFANGDVMSLRWKLGEILRDVVVKRELAAFDLLHDSDSGERKHRADDVIDGVRPRGRFESNVGYTITLEKEDTIASCNQHRGTYYV